MPIMTYDPEQALTLPFQEESQTQFQAPQPSQWEIMKSAFQRENVIGSLFSSKEAELGLGISSGNREITDFDPFTYLDSKGRPRNENELKAVTFANTPEEVDKILSIFDNQRYATKILEQSGTAGLIWSMVAGVVDPTILIPGTAGFKTISKLGRVSAGIGTGTGLGALATGIQEGVLQGTQEERPIEETVLAIVAGAALGGVLGGASQFIGGVDKTIVEQVVRKELGETSDAKFFVSDNGRVLLECDPT